MDTNLYIVERILLCLESPVDFFNTSSVNRIMLMISKTPRVKGHATYILSINKMGACRDCGQKGKLYKEDACGDCHTGSYQCCYKLICKGGCQFTCPKCHKIATKVVDSDHGWWYQQKCEFCHNIYVPEFSWWGNSPHENCRRYCNCGLDDINLVTGSSNYYDEE